MKADGGRATHAGEGGRQHVLAAVLLAVIAASRGIDLAMDPRARLDRRLDQVRDALRPAINHLDDASAVEQAGIVRLSARGRIERGPIQTHVEPPLGRRALPDDRLEAREGAVLVVEPVRHRVPPATSGSGTPASAKPRARRMQLSHRPQGRPPGSGS